MLRVRLMRMGVKKKPFYRIVVVDSRRPRKSKYKDIIGYYNPMKEPAEIKIDREKVNLWVSRGAQPSETVKSLLTKVKESKEASIKNA
ncbi:MAG: 30S ribosomal protein S16 [Candidatus Aminicenantia bacterium]